jgi:hypothetical protein
MQQSNQSETPEQKSSRLKKLALAELENTLAELDFGNAVLELSVVNGQIVKARVHREKTHI